jgi:hypothetical protein
MNQEYLKVLIDRLTHAENLPAEGWPDWLPVFYGAWQTGSRKKGLLKNYNLEALAQEAAADAVAYSLDDGGIVRLLLPGRDVEAMRAAAIVLRQLLVRAKSKPAEADEAASNTTPKRQRRSKAEWETIHTEYEAELADDPDLTEAKFAERHGIGRTVLGRNFRRIEQKRQEEGRKRRR